MAIRMSGTQLRAEISEILSKVTQADEVVEITRYGKTEAYVISSDRYERLTRNLFTND
jgi:prevent-host-death family protein